MQFIKRLSEDFSELSVIIKYGDMIIGKLPLVLLTFFDIYDCVKEFDKIISIPCNLVDKEYIDIFLKNIIDILSFRYNFNAETCANIFVILEYLQYNDINKACMRLNSEIQTDLDFNVLLLNKTNKIICPAPILLLRLERIEISVNNIQKIVAIMSLILPTDWQDRRSYIEILKNITGAGLKNDNIRNATGKLSAHICKIFGLYEINLNICPISDEYHQDWNTLNIKSPIAKLYSVRISDIKTKDVFPETYFHSRKLNSIRLVQLSNYFLAEYTDYRGCVININTMEAINIPVFRVFSGRTRNEDYFSVDIDNKYRTNDYYLAIDF